MPDQNAAERLDPMTHYESKKGGMGSRMSVLLLVMMPPVNKVVGVSVDRPRFGS